MPKPKQFVGSASRVAAMMPSDTKQASSIPGAAYGISRSNEFSITHVEPADVSAAATIAPLERASTGASAEYDDFMASMKDLF